MRYLFSFLSALAGLYSLLIFIRILLSWFSAGSYGAAARLLERLTDPWLDFWRGKLPLRTGMLDLSPILAIAVLSILQSIFSRIALYGRISLGVILAVALGAIWSALSFILGFCFIMVTLRFICYMTNGNIYSPFWRVIDSISAPILYRINRIIFGKRLVNYMKGIAASLGVLALFWLGGKLVVKLLSGILLRLPV